MAILSRNDVIHTYWSCNLTSGCDFFFSQQQMSQKHVRVLQKLPHFGNHLIRFPSSEEEKINITAKIHEINPLHLAVVSSRQKENEILLRRWWICTQKDGFLHHTLEWSCVPPGVDHYFLP